MKTRLKFLLLLGGMFASISCLTGCGTIEETSSSIAESGQSEDGSSESNQNENTNETNEEVFEEKDEYHVGDVLKDGNMKITYLASGSYEESNEYLQPQAGNKLIFIKLGCENIGDSDATISFYSFECYADGYNVDVHYTDNDLSASLSPGRSTDGMIVFEVPENAEKIEIEYETNFITGNKIKFVYDGEKDSGLSITTNESASAEAYSVGDTVELSSLYITYMSCEKDTSYSEYSKPTEGFHYVTLTLEVENKGENDEFVSMYDFDCYADGKDCEMAYFRDDTISAELSSGRKANGTVTFQVPDDATTIEVEFVSNMWTSSRVVFKVQE